MQDELDRHGITLNKNCVPNETRSPQQTSGVRIGTAAMTTKGYTEADFLAAEHRIDEVLRDYAAFDDPADPRSALLVECGQHWERAAPGAEEGGGGGDGLVWCLRAAEAGRLAAAYRLGRLLQVLAPVQLKLLVFPGPRLADGPSLGEAAAAGGLSAAELDTAVRLARERAVPIVLAGCVWEALPAPETRGEREGAVPPGPSEAGPIVAARRAYAALVASLEQGAAARRRVPSPGKRAYAAVE